MVTRKHLGVAGALFTLNLAALPALSQTPPAPGEAGQQAPLAQRGRPGQPPPQGDPFGQPGRLPGQPGFAPDPMMMLGTQSPELAKKMRSIMALREMLGMRLTSRNISAALPILKELRDAEKTMQSRAEQLLEEERKALLAAEPDEPPPPGAGEKMQMEMQRYHDKQMRAWENLVQAIGPEKTIGIRRLLGQGGLPPNIGGGNDPFGQPVQQGQPGFAPLPGQPVRPAPGLPPDPNGLPTAEAPPVLALEAYGAVPEAPNEFGQQPPPGVQPGNPGQPGQPPRPFNRPNARNLPQPGAGGPFAENRPFFQSPRLTLVELVELMEQKLAATRR